MRWVSRGKNPAARQKGRELVAMSDRQLTGRGELPAGQEKERYVREMFRAIARRYDLLNRLLSFGRDVGWRRFAARVARLSPGDEALDVATGTGDLALELARYVVPGGRVVGVDFVEEMLALARQKVARHPLGQACQFMAGDAMALPFPDGRFAAATIGFALRNVRDVAGCLAEMRRVVRPGGWVVSLELSKPVWPIFKQVYWLYFHRLVPVVGRLLQGVDGPYAYLPRSVERFPDQERLAEIMRQVGLKDVQYWNLTGGIAAVHVGRR